MSEQSRKYSHTAGIDNNHDCRVRIPFSYVDGDGIYGVERGITEWNETCAKAIELFGLPGDKYTCRFTQQAIEFWFLEERDALLFELTCG